MSKKMFIRVFTKIVYLRWLIFSNLRVSLSRLKIKWNPPPPIDPLRLVQLEWTNSDAPRRKNVCFYSHFDPAGQVDPYVLFMLDHLQEELDCDLYFCSTSQSIDPAALKELQKRCRAVLVRANQGIDFGSWKTLYLKYKNELSAYEHLFLCNDSIYGPVNSLKPLLAHPFFTRSEPAVWGLTDSYDISYHLQSYFLAFNQHAIADPAFDAFWSSLKILPRRHDMIYHYETQLLNYFRARGFSFDVAFPLENLVDTQNLAWKQPQIRKHVKFMNQSEDFWQELITKHQFPFLKRKILTDWLDKELELEPIQRTLGDVGFEQFNVLEAHARRYHGAAVKN